MVRKTKEKMAEEIYAFYPQKEAQKDEVETIRALEKICGNDVSILFGVREQRYIYEGIIRKTGIGIYFSGHDKHIKEIELKGSMLSIVRNTDYDSVIIQVLGLSSGSH